MTPAWHFRKFKPGDALSDPDFTKALFAKDSDSSLARSLVRESIQNSLDAKRADCRCVDLRISVNSGSRALPSSEASQFFSGIFPHLEADDSGLVDSPTRQEPVPFLVIEDFGTHGLRGDPSHWKPKDAKRNPFFLFFRALGRSGKADEDRGRWGVGKYVFPLSSRANAAFGFTVASDNPAPRLMGRMLLRTHSVGDDAYHPDGHWGLRDRDVQGLTGPVEDPDTTDRFRSAFRLKRNREPGLSVVIPWLREEVTADAIRDAVVREYFLPLLRNQVRVELWWNGQSDYIDAETVRQFAATCEDKLLAGRLALADKICSGAAPNVLEWPQDFAWDDTVWRPDAISPELAQALNASLDAGEPVSVRLVTSVRQSSPKGVQYGDFFVHLLGQEGLGSARPLIIREGITLPADKTRPIIDHIALVVADRGPIATMIGDAETPAHEELQHTLIKDKYSYPKKAISFVREAAAQILAILHDTDASDDPLLLANFFPLAGLTGKSAEAPTRRKEGEAPEPKPVVPRQPPRFRLDQLKGGFRIQATPDLGEIPPELVITMAYDVRRGNPFGRYNPLDFDVGRSPIEVAVSDAELSWAASNEIVARPTGPNFSIQALGFDPYRDLKVRVTASSPAQ